MSVDALFVVSAHRDAIETCLYRLSTTKPDDSPQVSESDCAELLQQLRDIQGEFETEEKTIQWQPVEAVVRDISLNLITSIDTSRPVFDRIWVLIDVITVLSDHDLCEGALNFWLVEELLDSQKIDGCRKIFDYLESRREKMIAKHFGAKKLVILRCCNELLRRLSRAEDTVFCGRVFIYLFQSFDLGDKSSVNLRGEFHVENVTTFDSSPRKSEGAIKPMEIDTEGAQPLSSGGATPTSTMLDTDNMQKTSRSTPAPRSVKSDTKATEEAPDLDTLYPKFWALQNLFSSPTRLFEQSSMVQLREGLNMTLACFKSISTNTLNNAAPTPTHGTKRKRSELNGANGTTAYNPKYLTNRDLFDLEVHDLAFRRHILVQSLIMLDFLLALSPAAKAKSTGLTNKSVLYAHTLSDDDLKWCLQLRASIATYLQSQGPGNEGKFYYRMVDTVLSRDKNWVRWKGESCPKIIKDSVPLETYVASQKILIGLTQKKPMKRPDDAAMFDFLLESEPMESLKHPSKRHRVPSMEDYYKSIQVDDLDLDFATEDEKKEIEERKAGKLWRALRASVYEGKRTKLCEAIEDGKKLKALIGEEEPEVVPEAEAEAASKQNGASENMKSSDAQATTDIVKPPEAMAVEQTDGPAEPSQDQIQPEAKPGQEARLGTPNPGTDMEEATPETRELAEATETTAEAEETANISVEAAVETAEAQAVTHNPAAPLDDAEMDDFAPGGMGDNEEGAGE